MNNSSWSPSASRLMNNSSWSPRTSRLMNNSSWSPSTSRLMNNSSWSPHASRLINNSPQSPRASRLMNNSSRSPRTSRLMNNSSWISHLVSDTVWSTQDTGGLWTTSLASGLPNIPAISNTYLRDRCIQTIVRTATLRYKLQIKLATSPSHSILTLGQLVPLPTL